MSVSPLPLHGIWRIRIRSVLIARMERHIETNTLPEFILSTVRVYRNITINSHKRRKTILRDESHLESSEGIENLKIAHRFPQVPNTKADA